MTGVSLQCLSSALAIALIVIAGGIIGALSISLGNEAVDRTKGTWKEGLFTMNSVSMNGFHDLSSACDEGITNFLSRGTEVADQLTLDVMTSAMAISIHKMETWADAPMQSVAIIRDYFKSLPPADWVDTEVWRRALNHIRTVYLNGFGRGVKGISIRASREQPVDGVDVEQFVQWMVNPPNRNTDYSRFVDYVPFEVVVPIRFDCNSSYSEAQCRTNNCIWCTGPAGGVCANPMRKDVTVSPPVPSVCPSGYALPQGYRLQWYQTTFVPYALGFAREDGTPYLGSCGLRMDGAATPELGCGCNARNDYILKGGSAVNLVVNGSFASTLKRNGEYPAWGTNSVTEPGMCRVPEGLSGLSQHTGLIRSGKYGHSKVHWSVVGLETVGPKLELPTYVFERVCLPGDANCLTLSVQAGIDTLMVTEFLKKAVENTVAGTRLYAVQRDSLRAGKCEDDFYRVLEIMGLNCAILQILGAVCDEDLFQLPIIGSLFARHILFRDLCPASCDICSDGRYPVRLVEGVLLGASRGDAHVNIPVNESSLQGLGISDMAAAHATESSDPIISGHARAVVANHGGLFSELPPRETWTGDATSNLTWWVMARHTKIGDDSATQLVMTVIMLVNRSAAVEPVIASMDDTRQQFDSRQRESISRFNELVNSSLEAIYSNDRETEEDKTKGFIILYSSVGFFILVLMALSVFLVRLIVAPLLQLQQDMSAVAVMRLEGVDRERTLSRLSEVKSMQISFRSMVSNLIEFRSYMPPSVLVHVVDSPVISVTDDDDDNDDDDSESKRESWSTRGTDTSEMRTPAERRLPTNNEITLLGLTRSVSANIKAPIKKVRVTLVNSNVVGYLGTHLDLASASHSEWMAADVGQWVQSVTAAKGLADTVSGDRRSASFNARQGCSNHAAAAISVAFSRTGGVSLSSGVATGPAVCGDFGSASLVRFMILGTVPTFVPLLERAAREWDCRVLVSQEVYGDAELKWDGLLKGIVTYSKWRGQSNRLFSITGAKKVGMQDNDEWMYQLASIPQNVHERDNEAAEIVIKKQLDAALEHEQSLQQTEIPHAARDPANRCWVMREVGLYPLTVHEAAHLRAGGREASTADHRKSSGSQKESPALALSSEVSVIQN
eukprot:Hpha_TRINITY_DN12588_c0_g1::TRINITY_DN12588_c0_g1_i1::g.50835::m.50835